MRFDCPPPIRSAVIVLIPLAVFLTVLLTSCLEQPPVSASDTDRSPLVVAAGHVGTGFDKTIVRVMGLLDRYGYWALFVAIFVEGFGIPAPGQSLLIAASLESVHGHLSIYFVLLVALIAAGTGNSVGYALGRWGGRQLLAKVRVNETHLLRVEARFNRHGALVLLFARFLDGFRQLNGIVAGILQMGWRRFSIFNTLGSLLWTATWGLGTYVLDRRIAALHVHFGRLQFVSLVIAVGALITILVYIIGRRKRR